MARRYAAGTRIRVQPPLHFITTIRGGASSLVLFLSVDILPLMANLQSFEFGSFLLSRQLQNFGVDGVHLPLQFNILVAASNDFLATPNLIGVARPYGTTNADVIVISSILHCLLDEDGLGRGRGVAGHSNNGGD